MKIIKHYSHVSRVVALVFFPIVSVKVLGVASPDPILFIWISPVRFSSHTLLSSVHLLPPVPLVSASIVFVPSIPGILSAVVMTAVVTTAVVTNFVVTTAVVTTPVVIVTISRPGQFFP